MASLVGLGLVVLFMLAFYKLSGINAIVAMTVNLLVLLALMVYFHATMTLPGIAGFILTIGMGVDSNVLIFERIKEELLGSKGVRAAVQAGFDRVFLTILDTHVASLIAAAFLFQFGTGPIRGFATTLSIGLLTNVFTSVFVSRALFELVLGQSRTAQAQHLAGREASHADPPQHELRLHPVALARADSLVGADHRAASSSRCCGRHARWASTSRAARWWCCSSTQPVHEDQVRTALDARARRQGRAEIRRRRGAPDHDPPAAGQRRREGVQPRAGREGHHATRSRKPACRTSR